MDQQIFGAFPRIYRIRLLGIDFNFIRLSGRFPKCTVCRLLQEKVTTYPLGSWATGLPPSLRVGTAQTVCNNNANSQILGREKDVETSAGVW